MATAEACGGDHVHLVPNTAPDEAMIASMDPQDSGTPPSESHLPSHFTNSTSLMFQHTHTHQDPATELYSPRSKTTGTPAMPIMSKHADHAIAPFYARHVPSQYNPVGVAQGQDHGEHITSPSGGANTKFCNRHRPDLKCRRQANEPSMDELQAVRVFQQARGSSPG